MCWPESCPGWRGRPRGWCRCSRRSSGAPRSARSGSRRRSGVEVERVRVLHPLTQRRMSLRSIGSIRRSPPSGFPTQRSTSRVSSSIIPSARTFCSLTAFLLYRGAPALDRGAGRRRRITPLPPRKRRPATKELHGGFREPGRSLDGGACTFDACAAHSTARPPATGMRHSARGATVVRCPGPGKGCPAGVPPMTFRTACGCALLALLFALPAAGISLGQVDGLPGRNPAGLGGRRLAHPRGDRRPRRRG